MWRDTVTPNAGGHQMKRGLAIGLFSIVIAMGQAAAAQTADEPAAAENDRTNDRNGDTATDTYMKLGTPGGELGGEYQQEYERSDIKSQILTFIPPLLTPAFVQHAFVLPPGVFQVSVAERFVKLNGDDFFKDGSVDSVEFKDRTIDRHITDFDLFYGFDLNRKYLHSFTLAVNVPYINSGIHGSVHPPENPMVTVNATASSQEIGDVTVVLKKKIVDQGNFPVGVAAAGGLTLPTGKNDVKFGDNGFADMIIPGMPIMNMPFDRFTPDGRLPAPLQPGLGGVSYIAALFVTRQFNPGDFPGRSALHAGVAHQFVSEHDGVDLGDTTTVFTSYVRPIYKDYVAADLTFVGFYKEHDHYDGRRASATALPLGVVTIPREDFSGGWTGFFAPSLIFSPDPQIRFTGSFLYRAISPDLGPAPPWVVRVGLSVTF